MQDTPNHNIEDLPSWVATDEEQLIKCFRLIDEVAQQVKNRMEQKTTYRQGQGGIIL